MSFDESRLRELQGALREKIAFNKTIADSFRIEDGTVIVEQSQKDAFHKNMTDIKELRGLIEGVEALRDGDSWSRQPDAESIAAAAAAAVAGVSVPSGKSLGQLFVDSPEFKTLNGGRNGLNMAQPFTVNSGDIGSLWGRKDVFSAMPSEGAIAHFGRVERDPIILPPVRTRRVRELFPARSTTAAVIEYFRMTGFTNGASVVPERSGNQFGLKPQSGMTFVGEQATVRTIAHWEAAHRNVLSDEPQLRSIIDNELLYGLRLQEDYQILQGSGTGEDLLGILNVPGIQNYNWSSGETAPVADNKADAIRRAATLAFLAYYEPTGVVLHPNDWEDIELTKNAQGTYLMAISMNTGAEARVWRLPVIDTPAMPEGQALVGAFGTGAQLYDREQASIRISEQHADFFIRNAVVILAEQRLALATKRPESFVSVNFDSAPA